MAIARWSGVLVMRWVVALCSILIFSVPAAERVWAADRLPPVAAAAMHEKMIQLVAGGYQTCALTQGGDVWCWGDNLYGQLGDGTNISRRTPVMVKGLNGDITAITAGGSHICALTRAGGVWCWGGNSYGQLGDGSTTARNLPVAVAELRQGVTAITGGGAHTCAFIEGGDVQCWGTNDYGQAGSGSPSHHTAPVSVAALRGEIAAISPGVNYTCALTHAGNVLCWGYNSDGQLGSGSPEVTYAPVAIEGLGSSIQAITALQTHTCALAQAGNVLCWGSNESGELGDGSTKSSSTPVAVADLGNTITAISVSNFFTCALTATAGVKCWGNNTYGNLGDGSQMNRTRPVDVAGLKPNILSIATGSDHACVLTELSEIQCWGSNAYGQLGDGTHHNRNTAVAVLLPQASNAISVYLPLLQQ